MNALATEFYGNSLLQWLIAGAIFVVTIVVLVIARVLALKAIKAKTMMRAFFRVAIGHTRYLFLAVVAAGAASL
ncbi:MAG: hypothetical protein ABIS03_01755, partial [Gemmatimonadaceae bacterium]